MQHAARCPPPRPLTLPRILSVTHLSCPSPLPTTRHPNFYAFLSKLPISLQFSLSLALCACFTNAHHLYCPELFIKLCSAQTFKISLRDFFFSNSCPVKHGHLPSCIAFPSITLEASCPLLPVNPTPTHPHRQPLLLSSVCLLWNLTKQESGRLHSLESGFFIEDVFEIHLCHCIGYMWWFE